MKFDESIDVILTCWTSEQRFSHKENTGPSTTSSSNRRPPESRIPPSGWAPAAHRSIREVARRGFNLLLGRYSSPDDLRHNIAVFQHAVESQGQVWDPIRVGVTRAFFVAESEHEREQALERRLADRKRQLKLATTPDGRMLGGPDRADGNPNEINRNSAIYGSPDQIAQRLNHLRTAGVGYVLINGGGSGGGERGLRSLRRFAREIMPGFTSEDRTQAAD